MAVRVRNMVSRVPVLLLPLCAVKLVCTCVPAGAVQVTDKMELAYLAIHIAAEGGFEKVWGGV